MSNYSGIAELAARAIKMIKATLLEFLSFLCALLPMTSCAQVASCPSEPRTAHFEDRVDIYVCSNNDWKFIHSIDHGEPGVGLETIERSDASSLLLVNDARDLAATPHSIKIMIFDIESGDQIFDAFATTSAETGDRNSDGIVEIVLYENILDFDFRLLAGIGWPTIVELSDPISLNTIDDYDSIRAQLLQSSKEWQQKLEFGCVNDGKIDPRCSLKDDIEKLGLFIDILSTPH